MGRLEYQVKRFSQVNHWHCNGQLIDQNLKLFTKPMKSKLNLIKNSFKLYGMAMCLNLESLDREILQMKI